MIDPALGKSMALSAYAIQPRQKIDTKSRFWSMDGGRINVRQRRLDREKNHVKVHINPNLKSRQQ